MKELLSSNKIMYLCDSRINPIPNEIRYYFVDQITVVPH